MKDVYANVYNKKTLMIVTETEMKKALDMLIDKIKLDYSMWSKKGGSDYDTVRNNMIKEFNDGITMKESKYYYKIYSGNSIWGFIVKEDKTIRGKDWTKGDILKAASYLTPALNKPRGNIFDNYIVKWTGPVYLNDPAYYRMIGQ